jgi:hypothetical protein
MGFVRPRRPADNERLHGSVSGYFGWVARLGKNHLAGSLSTATIPASTDARAAPAIEV